MRVAFLTARFPWPPDRGDRLNAFHLLRALRPKHEVTLFSFVDGTESPGAREAIATLGVRIETVPLSRARSWFQAWLALPGARPSQVAYYDSAAMHTLMRRSLTPGAYDVVYVQLFRMAPFVASLPHPAKVLFLTDSIGLNLRRSLPHQAVWRRPGQWWEARRVDRYERDIAPRFREAWVVSEPDAADLRARGVTNVVVMPHGVDESLFGCARRPATPPEAVFLGNLSVPHNVDAAVFAASEVWPLVRAKRPDARLKLVGAAPSARVRGLDAPPAVQVTGPVEELRRVWETPALLLAPLRYSSGIQNKVLEAMAARVPVVTTPGAADAVGAVDGEHAWVASDAAGLAAAVLDVLDRPDEAARRAENAERLLRARFRWETFVDRLERLAASAPDGPGSAA